jgi:hypothetical protein
MKLKFFILGALMFHISLANAANKGGFFVEPMLTYERGEGEVDFPQPINSSDTDVNGFGVGARLGFHVFESIFIGADGRYSMPKFEDTSIDQKTDAKAWNYGPVLGIQMPTAFALRIWGGYIMDGELDPDKDRNVDMKFSDGKGYRVGAGIKLGFVSLNLEYQDMKYEKTKIEEAGVFTPGYSTRNIELDNSSWILSASFPISL